MPASDDRDPARLRLGQMLRRRRVNLDLRYRNRRVFLDERARGINERMLQDIENGARGGYKEENKAAIEEAYALVPGSLDRTLASGELEPQPSAADLTPAELAAKFIEFLEWDKARKEAERSA